MNVIFSFTSVIEGYFESIIMLIKLNSRLHKVVLFDGYRKLTNKLYSSYHNFILKLILMPLNYNTYMNILYMESLSCIFKFESSDFQKLYNFNSIYDLCSIELVLFKVTSGKFCKNRYKIYQRL